MADRGVGSPGVELIRITASDGKSTALGGGSRWPWAKQRQTKLQASINFLSFTHLGWSWTKQQASRNFYSENKKKSVIGKIISKFVKKFQLLCSCYLDHIFSEQQFWIQETGKAVIWPNVSL